MLIQHRVITIDRHSRPLQRHRCSATRAEPRSSFLLFVRHQRTTSRGMDTDSDSDDENARRCVHYQCLQITFAIRLSVLIGSRLLQHFRIQFRREQMRRQLRTRNMIQSEYQWNIWHSDDSPLKSTWFNDDGLRMSWPESWQINELQFAVRFTGFTRAEAMQRRWWWWWLCNNYKLDCSAVRRVVPYSGHVEMQGRTTVKGLTELSRSRRRWLRACLLAWSTEDNDNRRNKRTATIRQRQLIFKCSVAQGASE